MKTAIIIIFIMYICGFRVQKLFKSNWFAILIAGFFAAYVTNKVFMCCIKIEKNSYSPGIFVEIK